MKIRRWSTLALFAAAALGFFPGQFRITIVAADRTPSASATQLTEIERPRLAALPAQVEKPVSSWDQEWLALARRVFETGPALALEPGVTLITALAHSGEFAAAARLAQDVNAPEATRKAWLSAAFARWGENLPPAAAAAAMALRDESEQHLALRAAVAARAQTEPAGLADFSVRLPVGEDRTCALGEALRQWIESATVAAAAWLDHFEPNADLDQAAAPVATRPFLAARRPEVAVGWAETIADSHLRTTTLVQIVQEWSRTDPAAARRYAQSLENFRPEDRADLANAISGGG